MRKVVYFFCAALALLAGYSNAAPISAAECGDQYPFQQQIDTAAQVYVARASLAGPSGVQYRNVRLVCRARSVAAGVFEQSRTTGFEIDLDVNVKNSHGDYVGFETKSISLAGEELTVTSSEAIVVTGRANLSPPPILTAEDCDGVAPPCRPNPARGALVVPGTGVPKPADDGPRGIDRAFENATLLFESKRFVELDALIDRYATLKDRVDDGRFKLSGIDDFLNFAGQARNDALLGEVESWRSENSNSIGAALLEAQHWYNAAWRARGGGLSNSVAPEGWKLFFSRLEKAKSALTKSESYAASNPLWFTKSLEVQLALNVTAADRLSLYKRGISAFPEFFPLHFSYLYGLQPKWGGSNEAMAAFIDGVVTSRPSDTKAQMYTRLWWYVDQISPNEISVFRDMGASWPRMKAGFDSLAKNYPDSIWIRMNYASFACRAGDSATYKRLRSEVGSNFVYYGGAAFPSNFSLEVCDERASQLSAVHSN